MSLRVMSVSVMSMSVSGRKRIVRIATALPAGPQCRYLPAQLCVLALDAGQGLHVLGEFHGCDNRHQSCNDQQGPHQISYRKLVHYPPEVDLSPDQSARDAARLFGTELLASVIT